MTEIIFKNKNYVPLKNKDIRICISCGSLNIDSYEFGISCEDCGILIGRK